MIRLSSNPEQLGSGIVAIEDFGALVRCVYQAHTARFRSMIPEANLTISQFQVLHSIRAIGPCSLSAVGRYLKLDQATTCGVVSRLRARRLVSVQKNNEDHRQLILKIERLEFEDKAGLGKLKREVPGPVATSAILPVAPMATPVRDQAALNFADKIWARLKK